MGIERDDFRFRFIADKKKKKIERTQRKTPLSTARMRHVNREFRVLLLLRISKSNDKWIN